MKHHELVQHIIRTAAELGLLAHYCARSEFCVGNRGLPDLIIAGPRGMILAEIKTGSGDLTAEQDLWVWMIAQSDQKRGVVWRENHWETDIRKALTMIADPGT